MLHDIVLTRVCNTCSIEKQLDQFHRDVKALLGRSRKCKACACAKSSAWVRENASRAAASRKDWKRRNPDTVLESSARYRSKNPARVREIKRVSHQRHIEKRRARAREYARMMRAEDPGLAGRVCRAAYWRNPEKYRERSRQFARKHPEYSRAGARLRKARKKASPVRERVYRSVVWKRDAGVCRICRIACDPLNWHMDHVVPLSRGGHHTYANVAVSHPTCNLKKGSSLEAVA